MILAPSRGRLRVIGLVTAFLCALLATAAIRAQGEQFRPGTTTPPPRTDAGEWAGTWFYTSRDFRVALWFTETGGQIAMRLRYLDIGTLEGFETDWTGVADYTYAGWPGRFRFNLTESNPDTLSGDWSWELTKAASKRVERARVILYRTTNGRQAVMQFDDFVRSFQLSGETHEVPASFFWVLRKGSSRLVLWEELPF